MDAKGTEKRERALEAAVALLQGAPGHRMQITNLNKALFYLDLVALRDTGKMLTQNRYLALAKGPVVDGYQDELIPALEARGLARQDREGMAQPVVLKRELESFHYLDDQLRALAAQVAGRIATKTAGDVSDLSHKNPGWQMAHAQGVEAGRPPVAINMLIALQQLAERDSWLEEPIDDEQRDIFDAADLLASEEW